MKSNPDYFRITQEFVSILQDEEGWSENYAQDVLLEQVYRTYIDIHDIDKMDRVEAIERFKEEADREAFTSMADRLIELISKYKPESEVDSLGRRLKRVLRTKALLPDLSFLDRTTDTTVTAARVASTPKPGAPSVSSSSSDSPSVAF